MIRFLLLFFMLVGISSASYARALTSIQVDGKSYNLVIYSMDEHDYPIKLFNDNIAAAKLTEQIRVCSFVIDIPAGTGKGNHSYGGYCTSQKDATPRKIMVCGDFMRGTIKIEPLGSARFHTDGINNLARFVVENCYGG